MILTFTNALWIGFGIFTALVGVYLFRTRSKPRIVSSLMLWVDRSHPSEGGRFFQSPQIPLLLILEMMIVALLTVAAAGPRIMSGQAIPLVIILDDSFSMQADEPNSPRMLAIRAIEAELEADSTYRVQLIAAGSKAEFIGETCHTLSQIRALWPLWKCGSSGSNIEQGIDLARSTRKYDTRILVITDRAPETPLADDRLEWWAFGRPLDNLAITNGGRTTFGSKDRFFVEIANLSSRTVKITGEIENLNKRNFQFDLEAFESHREIFGLESPFDPVYVRLPADSLPIDNEMVLVPLQQRLVKVAFQIDNSSLRDFTERALTATGLITTSTASSAELLIRTAAQIPPSHGQWIWEFASVSGAKPFLGPFAVDRTSPLADGLVLDGVIWGGSLSEPLRGSPVLLLVDTPLLTDEQLAHGGHYFRFRYDLNTSNFHNTPNWPILFWNLVKWRQTLLPGPVQFNLRLGMEATIRVTPDVHDLQILAPDGGKVLLQPIGDLAAFLPVIPGLYRVENGSATSLFAVNCMAKDESDLSRSVTGHWGNWNRSEEFHREFVSWAWLFLVPAVFLLGIHLFLISGGAK